MGADIDRFYSQRERDVRILSQADVLEGDNIDAIIKYLTEIIEETPYLDDIDVIGNDGIIIASSGEQNEKGMRVLEQHPSLESLIGAVRNAEQGQVFVSGIVELDSGPGLAFLTPITDDTNTIVIKILLVEINLETVTRIVADFDDRVIGAKYVYLVDNSGRVIVSADPESSLLSSYPDLSVRPELLDNFSLQGDVGSVIYRDNKGEEVMAGFADMDEFGVNKAMDWSIIAVAPIADITRPVDEFRNGLLVFTATVAGAVIFFIYLASRGIVRSLQILVDGAQRVGSGNIKHRIDLDQADEFGLLARTINHTLDNLALAERKILDRTTQLEVANAELDAFAQTVSHDLRAPLRGMDGFARALIEDYGDKFEGEARDFLGRISKASRRMGQMIDDILMLSRATRQEKLTQDVNLSDIAQKILADLSERDRDRSVTIEIEPNVTARGDPILLQTVLDNLLGNAWKFTSKKETAKIEFGMHPGEPKPVYFVRDNGAGFDMTYVDKLFGIFQRLHSTAQFEGSGVGLATVARLVRRHGGRVWAEGEENKGASFYFTLED